MEPSEFLDILGNENRRKILALLADRPYFVSEISNRIDVAPKAVIGHLSLLESSGLIESSVDDQRRKYYSISKSLLLEVSVSPYSYSVHVNNFKLEIPEEPVYSLSVSFNANEKKSGRRRRRKKDRTLPTGPVIHLASSYADSTGSEFKIELIGPNHPSYVHLGLIAGIENKFYLSSGSGETNFDAESKRYFEEELNTVYDDSKADKKTPEFIFPDSDKDSSDNAGGNKDQTEGRLKSREGYFLSQIFKVRNDLADLWDEQEELSRMQEEISIRQNNLMRSFVHYATQLSENKVDLDILFRLLKQDMNTADLCHATGHAPSLILPRLKSFEEKKMVEKYLQDGDFVWRLKGE
ncbi:ArsR/SmtB family transcription factor [Methanimicrococcus blatticola]|uniref:Regulatory ArsR family protein n=1 Tax=Methanimicrococcus blatticola TaxID=91560 RepID=A0A484F4P5_9EURY|nr:ArsR family transcriptional regulator [Methanimicrococcus blatticola]MBZ3935328.1 ArsR family transcriptional regulator [Methanimicrococcus blatticola]MCC2508574.1 ArsR family transcriptional regulator [Methanimicrococcus blatticola]TDQ67882.1 regulatory ArsR family protein [Methanimicrococcus blatticola]